MKVLVARELSGAVRDAFIRLGHQAVSCDLLPSRAAGPHYQGNVLDVLREPWDVVIAFPPCTHLAVSGARHFAQKRKDGRQKQGIDFFMEFTALPHQRVAIENPIGIMSRLWRKPDQIIHPWQYGDPESKATCLWLMGLPKLLPTNVLEQPPSGRWRNQTPSGQNRLGPSPERANLRSKTYPGIAAAMAQQWGGKCES